MLRTLFDDFVEFVTTHNRLVVVLMLVLTAGVAVGTTRLDGGGGEDSGVAFPTTTPKEKADYIETHYASDGPGNDRVRAEVYVREEGGNALSKDALLATLRYQQTVTRNESVAAAMPADGGVRSVASLVATRLADDPRASLTEQRAALDAASEAAVRDAVTDVLAPGSRALQLLPTGYEPGTASAESHRLLFAFEATPEGDAPDAATEALYSAALDRDAPEFFTLGDHALAAYQQQNLESTTGLVLPVALALVLLVLAFTYRDIVDVVVGMAGVVVSILWMFGILGWLGVDVGNTMIIAPVLIAGLSIDYGFHVFTRYREQRGAGEAVAPPMTRSVRAVGFALAVVTVTTGIGFLSNVANPVSDIRTLGVGITLGVVSAFVVFVTLVPALKLSVDGALERLGLDRRKRPLGESALLEPLLHGSVTLAKRAAPVVIVVAVVAGTAGAVAWTGLDEEPFDRQREPAAEWKTELPEPLAWEETEYNLNDLYVQKHYRAVADDSSDRVQLLVEGDVTDDRTLASVQSAVDDLDTATGARVVSPLSVMERVAASDDAFASEFAAADGDGDGVPDRNLESLYDALYAAAPDRASRVVERTDGSYESLRVVGPADGGGSLEERADRQQAVADAIEAGAPVTATAVSTTTVEQTGIEAITDGILRVMVLALLAVSLTFVAVSRYVHGSATLGAVTVVPIVLVVGLVVAGMYALDVPLTLVTALLMSLVVGLGVDYNIHLSDRFAHELRAGRAPFEALETAVVGTGGALVGSALTTAVAFVSILLHPSPQLSNFGTLVVLALVASLVVSVVVLPSVLAVWSRHGRPAGVTGRSVEGDAAPTDD